jgi:hypothetical protein
MTMLLMTPKRDAVRAAECCPSCGAPARPGMLVSHIQAMVAAYYEIPVRYMTSEHRDWEVSHPRQVAMYLASELTPKSYPAIGRRFGNRDHARKAVQRRMMGDPELAADVEALRERLVRPVENGESPTISKNLDAENAIEQSVNMQAGRAAA